MLVVVLQLLEVATSRYHRHKTSLLYTFSKCLYALLADEMQ